MSADDSGAQPDRSEFAAEISALQHEVQLLRDMRHGLASQFGAAVIVEAVIGLIEERQAELERYLRQPS